MDKTPAATIGFNDDGTPYMDIDDIEALREFVTEHDVAEDPNAIVFAILSPLLAEAISSAALSSVAPADTSVGHQLVLLIGQIEEYLYAEDADEEEIESVHHMAERMSESLVSVMPGDGNGFKVSVNSGLLSIIKGTEAAGTGTQNLRDNLCAAIRILMIVTGMLAEEAMDNGTPLNELIDMILEGFIHAMARIGVTEELLTSFREEKGCFCS